MGKSLVAILHYNSVQYTDVLYEILKPFEGEDYDLDVIDNGSDPDKVSKYTTLTLEKNVYYGGGLDATMAYFLDNPQYDSMMLLNSDLILHGYNFVKSLRQELFSQEDIVAVSGCTIQPEKGQSYWKTNHCWGSKKLRFVPFADYQCCLLKRCFVEKVKAFESKFGWVQDVVTGIVCKNNGWKIGVCDWAPVLHFGNGSVKDNSHDPIIANYNQLADQELHQYLIDRGYWDDAMKLRDEAHNYSYNPAS